MKLLAGLFIGTTVYAADAKKPLGGECTTTADCEDNKGLACLSITRDGKAKGYCY